MTVEVTVRDETTAGEVLGELALQLAAERMTVRELIASRVEAEVRLHNAKGSGAPYRGLVQPTSQEQRLNGPHAPRRLDASAQVEVAVDAFARGRVLVLVDDRQVTELDEEVTLAAGSSISFLKLTPLVGG